MRFVERVRQIRHGLGFMQKNFAAQLERAVDIKKNGHACVEGPLFTRGLQRRVFPKPSIVANGAVELFVRNAP